MKKKSTKKVKNNRASQSDDSRALNRELGNFGLEPPKIYKNKTTDSVQSYDNDFSNLPSFSRQRSTSGKSSERGERRNTKSKTDSRKKSKLRRQIIFYCSLTLAIIAIVIVLSVTVLFKIHTITIKGNEVYSQQQIAAVLPIEKEENLFLFDKDNAANKVKENLPYVYDVDIKRKLFSTVIVTVTETPQVYCTVNNDNTYTYLDDTFKVLEEHGGAIPEGAIVLKNVKLKSAVRGQQAEFAKKKEKKNIEKLVNAVKDLNAENITAIYSKDVNNNYMEYGGRITIKLGTLDNLERKLLASFTAIEKLNETNPGAKGTITATNDKQIYFTDK